MTAAAGAVQPSPTPQSTAAELISVVICTRNRANLLKAALLSVIRQDFPQAEYEILVVDNASQDHTPDVVGGLLDSAPIRYLREERVGLCVARNTGWKAARGRIIAFFDDDALARPGWLRAIRESFADDTSGPIGVIGGPAHAIWQAPRPPWLADTVASCLTIIDWGPSRKLIPDPDREWLVGANMAVSRNALEEVGGFHPWLDRIEDKLLSSGDVFLQKAILRRGYRTLYVPEMAIDHLVPASRLRQEWFLQRFYWQGVSDAVMHLIELSPSPAGRLRAAIRRAGTLIRNRRRMKSLLSTSTNPDLFALKCMAALDLGFILGLLGAARR